MSSEGSVIEQVTVKTSEPFLSNVKGKDRNRRNYSNFVFFPCGLKSPPPPPPRRNSLRRFFGNFFWGVGVVHFANKETEVPNHTTTREGARI
jgi:hypothetical protein